MRVETFRFDLEEGWSTEPLPGPGAGEALVTVFGAPAFLDDPRPFAALADAYPDATVVGCSTAGEIHDTLVHDGSLSIAVARFERTRLRQASAIVGDLASSRGAGESIARALAAPDLRAVLVFSDGVCVNGTELLRGINGVLPPSVTVTGGLAADGSRFQRTWVVVGGRPTERRVVGVGLYGDAVRVAHGSRGGWDIFGPERKVTRAQGSALYEVDGQPALALYKKYLGDRADGLPSTALLFPLGLRANPADTKVLVRTVLAVDEAAQSMTFAGDIPQGSLVQLMRANFDRLIEGAAQAGREAMPDASSCLTIAISCVGRRLVLGERTEEEVEAAHIGLGCRGKLVGFYSYGEISPFAEGEGGDLHNQTMTVTSIWEA